MKPINSQERKTLYIQFLLLFLLTIVVIFITMHFYYSIPKKEMQMLQSQKAEFNSLGTIPRQVVIKMTKADSLLKVIADPTKPMDQPVLEITDALSAIKGLGEKNKSAMDTLFLKIYNNYFDMLTAKKENRNGSNTAGNYKELNAKYQELKEKFEKCDLENTKLTTQLQMLNNK